MCSNRPAPKGRVWAYCGSFTAGGIEVATGDGRLRVTREGKSKEFVSAVEQITFSGAEGRTARGGSGAAGWPRRST